MTTRRTRDSASSSDAYLNQVQEAFNRAHALYAIYRGKQTSADQTAADVAVKQKEARDTSERAQATAKRAYDNALAKAKEALDAAMAEQQVRSNAAADEVIKARSELEAYQKEIFEKLGVTVDVAPPSGGSHMRL